MIRLDLKKYTYPILEGDKTYFDRIVSLEKIYKSILTFITDISDQLDINIIFRPRFKKWLAKW